MSKRQLPEFDATFLTERISQLIGDEPKEFAFRVGISVSATYNYCRGRVPSTEVMFRISQAYGKPLGWFFRPKEGAEVTSTLHEHRFEVVPSRQVAVG